MYYYAILNNENICVGTLTEYVEVTHPKLIPISSADTSHIGQQWNGTTWEALSTPVQVETRLSKASFANRFTDEERINIDLASIDEPSAPIQQRRQAALIRARKEDWNNAQFIDLIDQRTIDGLGMLEQAGLIGEGAANRILSTPVQSQEVP